jgi:peptidoglycan-associated lipoprotein
MKLNKVTNLTVLGLALIIAAAGCKKGPTKLTELPGDRIKRHDEPPVPIPDPNLNPQPVFTNPSHPIDTTTTVTDKPVPFPPNMNFTGWPQDHEALKAQTVYFDYDKSAIKASEQSKLDEVANYLKGNPNAAVRVEGNCDERGTEEYNRSLGERRALASREGLIQRGIDVTRIDTQSNGEDNPAIKGRGEEAYSKNRRDEFIVLTPPKP